MTNIDLMNFWINSSDEDYEVMKVLHSNKKNSYCLFFGQMVIEKLLKALYAKNNKDAPHAPKTHNLILLSQKANLDVPDDIREKIQIINTFNISARYDDYKNSFYQKCTDEYTNEQVKNIKEVRKWLKEK